MSDDASSVSRSDTDKKSEMAVKPEKKGKRAFLVFFACVVMAGLWYVWRLVQAPAMGTITKGEVKYDLADPDLPPAIRTVSGEYFSVTIPETYREKRHEKPKSENTNVFERVFFTEENIDSRKLAVVIENRPSNGVRELSSFAFRELKPEVYERSSYEWNGRRIPTFTKSSVVYEITGYVEGDSVVASISVSSAIDTPEKLIGDFSHIVQSFQWTRNESQ